MKPMPHVLIVDDDADAARSLAEIAAADNFSTAIAGTLKQARQLLLLRTPDVVLLDLQLPDGCGLELFSDAATLGQTPVVLMTEHGTLESSVEALRRGATDYLLKPVGASDLRGALRRAVSGTTSTKAKTNGHAPVAVRAGEGSAEGSELLRGQSAAIQAVLEQVERVAPTSVTVLVTGESGSGKEVVARSIHERSRRRNQPFLAVNCGAISPLLIESEIFGHEKGSFTGAAKQHRGYFERANGGTLLLDEITEMPLELQVRLLRVLETGELLRVGADEPLRTDVRIIAATNRDPEEAVRSGKLREDLYFRLNVFRIHVPCLRNRLEDIPVLAQKFLDELNQEDGHEKAITPKALDLLAERSWPGNVRELRNAVQRAFIMAPGNQIEPQHVDTADAQISNGSSQHISVRVGEPLAAIERKLILATLEACGGQREKTADLLGVSAKTLYNRLKQYERGEMPEHAAR